MMKKLKNDGSGLVTVILTITFLLMLSSALLFMSYVSIQVRSADRQSQKNFYDAENYMNEIRAEVQKIAMEAISAAHKAAEVTNASADVEVVFAREFMAVAVGKINNLSSSDMDTLRQSIAAITTSRTLPYSLVAFAKAALKSEESTIMPISVSNGYVTVGDTGMYLEIGVPAGQTGSRPLSLTVEGFTLTYKDNSGYENSVTTDIVINVPPFLPTALYEYAIVADVELNNAGADRKVAVSGKAYAGKVSVINNNVSNVSDNELAIGSNVTNTASGNKEIISGFLVSKGTVTVSNNAKFSVTGTSTLWANRIEVGENGVFYLGTEGTGDTPATGATAYVADDLELKGKNASATLNGNYFGFGNGGDTAPTATPFLQNVGEYSSSILVSGEGVNLDLEGLSVLFLAGNAYVSNFGYTTYNPDEYKSPISIPMANSIAIKSDQVAYLVPERLLKKDSITTNPYYVPSNGTVPPITADNIGNYVYYDKAVFSTKIPNDSDNKTTLNDYNATVKPVYVSLNSSSGTLIYFFVTFNTQADAQAYFNDYLTYNSSSAGQYLSYYFKKDNDYRLPSSSSINTAGSYYDANKDLIIKSETGSDVFANMKDEAATYYKKYANLKTWLSEYDPEVDSAGDTPFKNYVNSNSALANGSTVIKFYADGDTTKNPVALVIPAGYYTNHTTYEFNPDDYLTNGSTTVKVIIAFGNVTVKGALNGLILSSGTVTLHANVSNTNSADVLAAFNAKDDKGNSLSDIMNNIYGGSVVEYANWKKNAG